MGDQPEPLLPNGVVAPILTPFEDDLSVSHDRFVAHAQRMLDEGCVGLAVFGTTGEALSVATREREAALEALVDGGIDPGVMVVGTGVTNLPGTVHLTRHAMELGCRACMVLPPFYFKDPDPEGLFRYFAGLVERIGDDRLRIMLYHIPQVAGVGIPVSLVARLHAEFPEVVRAGGGWTSVTPGSQQYWLQAFNNVLHGRWEKIDAGFGKSVLGYFGKSPLSPDPEVVKIAADQLELPPFDGDPLEAAPDTLAEAEAALKERGLEVTDENKFLVAAAIVPGKNMELNEGIRLLEGRSKITLPLKKKEPTGGGAALTAPTKTNVTVSEGGKMRTYEVIIEPPASATTPALGQTQTGSSQATDVFSPFEGNVELVEINVKVGDAVTQGQVVAAVEAMKAKHDVKAPCAGRVSAVHAVIGNEVSAGKPILAIEV